MRLWKTVIEWDERTFESIVLAEGYEKAIKASLVGLNSAGFLNRSDYLSKKYVTSVSAFVLDQIDCQAVLMCKKV